MATKAKWPKTVPVFTPSDIVKQSYTSRVSTKECHCAAGWLGTIFADYDAALGDIAKGRRVNRRFLQACHTLAGLLGIEVMSIPAWNDYSTREQVAKALNKTMAKLGYTEIIDA
jgi:hypothetical protein